MTVLSHIHARFETGHATLASLSGFVEQHVVDHVCAPLHWSVALAPAHWLPQLALFKWGAPISTRLTLWCVAGRQPLLSLEVSLEGFGPRALCSDGVVKQSAQA